MIVRMFKPRFAPLVLSGRKRQTIRPTPKRMPAAGEKISLREWMGKPYRSKQRVLIESELVAVRRIEIAERGWVWIDDFRIKSRSDFVAFAWADGFDSPEDLLAWFRETHGLPFDGVLLLWR